jgi:iron-sulfur cluster assembly protein
MPMAPSLITITTVAALQIRKSAQQQEQRELHLRLAARLTDGGTIEYAMGMDDEADGDVRVVASEVNVLISPGSVELLAGATLDYVEINPGDWRFIFVNPNDPSHTAPKPAE